MKTILHLCADIGSDSYYYDQDENYNVIKIGSDIGVENYNPPKNVYGVIANPVCTEFTVMKGYDKFGDHDKGMLLVNHCLRIIDACNPKFWVIENPATGRLRNYLGEPNYAYQPWHYGSPWTKKTALWGNFNCPTKIYTNWEDVQKNDKLYIRPTRKKPSLVFLHKSAINHIPEFYKFKSLVKNDSDFRSLCSQGFAKSFYESNK